jgi:hypothetical protein
MNIGLIDADLLDGGTSHPNLALLKISGSAKEAGDSTTLLTDYADIPNYDQVYISKVFSFTKVPDIVRRYAHIKIGGTGFFPEGDSALPFDVEHHMPDYQLYDEWVRNQVQSGKRIERFKEYTDYSIGFTTRGCFRKCSFCVNKRYDEVFRHSPVQEFLDTRRPSIYLWDDNFLGFPGWQEVLDELELTKKPFQFRQGLDIRLLTAQKAKRLSQVKYKGDYIFAFDYLKDAELIQRKLSLWRSYTGRSTKLYLLCGYETQDEYDIANLFERIKILMHYNCLPYVMRHERYLRSPFRNMYVEIARWCNQPNIFKKMSFREFCEANQKTRKTENLCSSVKALTDFESKFPKIGKMYFNLRYDSIKKI